MVFLKKTLRLFHERSFRTRLLVTYLFLALVPIILLGTVSYRRSVSMMEEQALTAYSQVLHQLGMNINTKVQGIEGIAYQIISNQDIVKILTQSKNNAILTLNDQLENFYYLRDTIVNYQNNTDVYRIRMYAYGNGLFNLENNNFFTIDKLETTDRELGLFNAARWQGTHGQDYIYMVHEDVATYQRLIREVDSVTRDVGIVSIDVREQIFRDLLQSASVSQDGYLYLEVGDRDITTYTGSAEYAGWSLADIKAAVAGPRGDSVRLYGEEYLCVRETINSGGWRLTAILSRDEILQKSRTIGTFTLLLTVGFGLMAVFVALLLSRGLSGDLRMLSHHLDAVGEGRYGQVIEVRGDNEIALLQRQYNTMTLKIQELIEEVYKTRIGKQQAELRALESQINPHFLYNTLDTVKWMALRVGAADIAAVVNALSRFFNLSLNKGREMTTVENEIEHVRVYMQIQKIRSKDRIRCNFEVDEDILQVDMLKLLLQPIVENAIKHGIEPKPDRSGTIRVRAGKKTVDGKQYLWFEIADDGLGMDEDTVKAVTEGQSTGYGMRNVIDRIRYFYDSDSRIVVQSAPDRGTQVILLLSLNSSSKNQ